jgi:hypothetical protein
MDCGDSKPIESFHKQGKYRRGYCRDCGVTRNRKYVQSQTPEQRRFYKIKQTYGLSRDDYIDILLRQDFRCPVCTAPLSFSGLHTDHCHETGKVRGILDVSCNTALGKFKDNIATLSRAQAYLEVARDANA